MKNVVFVEREIICDNAVTDQAPDIHAANG